MKKHGNQKYARKADSSLSLRVNSADKANWQRSAALHGMSLNEWVIHTLRRNMQRWLLNVYSHPPRSKL